MTSKRTLIALIVTVVLLLISAVSVLADPGDRSVEVADREGFAEATLDDGTIVQYIGDDNETFGPAGSGVFDSFVRLQGNEKKTDVEKGYNTDGTREWDTKAGKFTHSILLSEIPTIQVGGQLYWEFFADINDSDSTPLISLDDFELYLTDDPNLTGYPFTGTATEIYDYTDTNNGYYILINDVNQGSGRGDLRYLVPQDGFDPGDCNYGNPACTTYLVLYSVWGGKEGYGFDGGFEEWKVKIYPILDVSKDINGAFDTSVSWTITKDFDATYNLFTGDSVSHGYEVEVVRTEGDPENTMVSGTITIVGDDETTVDANLSDEFNGEPATITSCSVPQNEDDTYTIEAGATVACSYELELGDTDPVDGTNVALATFKVDGAMLAFQGSADILASEYVETKTGYLAIDVTDTNGESWSTSGSTSWTYSRTFACDGDEGSHTNTATITQTGAYDTATVTINCYALVVTKDASTSLTRTWDWTIDKSADQTDLNLFGDELFPVTYMVTVDASSTDSDWAVDGNISVYNPAPIDATINGVADVVSPDISASVDCGKTFPYKLVAGDTLSCTYSADLPDDSDRSNTATATLQNTPSGTTDFSGSEDVLFDEDTTIKEIDECIDVNDTNVGFLGTVCADQAPATFNYTLYFGANPDADVVLECGDNTHPNIADFVTNDTGATGSDDWTVNAYVECPNGCTPGFWQGGAGSVLWDGIDDDEWVPFTHDVYFNSYFYVTTDPDLDGFTMYALVSSGGGSNWAEKAARDMVAAYLNESAFPDTYPASSLTQLESDWYAAVTLGVAGDDSGYMAFHDEKGGWNSPPPPGYCPLP
jgi:hypothetical protein